MNGDSRRIAVAVAPYTLEQVLPPKRNAWAGGKKGEQIELARRQGDSGSLTSHFARENVDVQVANDDLRWWRLDPVHAA